MVFCLAGVVVVVREELRFGRKRQKGSPRVKCQHVRVVRQITVLEERVAGKHEKGRVS